MTRESQADVLREAFGRAVAAVSAANCLPRYLPGAIAGRTYVLAVGKAAAAMAEAVIGHLDVTKALVVYPDLHGPIERLPPLFECMEARHPVPDARGMRAAERALELARELGAGDRLIALISGGGSALLPAPVTGVSLEDEQALTRALLTNGASIAEINCVRQCLSRIKGGRLARAAGEAAVLTFVISDVPGDNLSLVASGPTLPSAATLAQARAILIRYCIEAPASVQRAMKDQSNTPVGNLPSAEAKLVAAPTAALQAAAVFLEGQGFRPVLLGDAIEGEARDIAQHDAWIAIDRYGEGRRVALIAGGEGTVRLPQEPPPGGRNLEYALALALALGGRAGISALACDSDGIDGTTPAAGAIVGPDTLAAIRSAGLDPVASLEAHRSYEALERIGALVVTGATRTNVNDIRILLIEPGA